MFRWLFNAPRMKRLAQLRIDHRKAIEERDGHKVGSERHSDKQAEVYRLNHEILRLENEVKL